MATLACPTDHQALEAFSDVLILESTTFARRLALLAGNRSLEISTLSNNLFSTNQNPSLRKIYGIPHHFYQLRIAPTTVPRQIVEARANVSFQRAWLEDLSRFDAALYDYAERTGGLKPDAGAIINELNCSRGSS